MAIGTCPQCKALANARECPQCGVSMALDETHPNEPTQRARDIQAGHLWRQREEKRRVYGPLSHNALHWIGRSLETAIDWCNEGKESEALLSALKLASKELDKIVRSRSA